MEEKCVEEKKLYSIGQVSKICDVSQRMLRYYEEIGLVLPDYVVEPSHYRYYSVQTMQHVQNIRYLIDQGFSLDEIKIVTTENNLDRFQELFLQKIDETKGEIEYYHQRLDCLRAWYALLVEGCEVYRHRNRAITAKYVPKELFFCYERYRNMDEKDPVAHLETESFTLTKHDGHSMVDMGGAFHVKYDSYRERMEETYRHMTLLQATFPNSKSDTNTMYFGGFMAISCYHIGSLNTVRDTYERMLEWAREHRFVLQGYCYERHVLDIYSTANEANFVTEVLLPVEEETPGFDFLDKWK